jgi:hypothetical protein
MSELSIGYLTLDGVSKFSVVISRCALSNGATPLTPPVTPVPAGEIFAQAHGTLRPRGRG